MNRVTVPSADTHRAMPRHAEDCVDRIDGALRALEIEERRLQRLGLEPPLARCRESRRYWSFLRAVFAVASTEDR